MTGRLLAALGVVVLVLLGGLWVKLRQDDAPAADASTPAAERAAGQADSGAGHTGSRTTTGPSARSRVTLPRAPSSHTPSAPSAPSSGGPSAPEPEPAAEAPTDQQMFRRSLVEQVGLTEPQIIECVEKATKSGASVDGTTAVSFTIAKGANGKLGIEATGIEYSSIPDQATTNCIRDIGKGLTFDALPDGADRVIAYRKVVVKDGKVTENWLTEFAKNPGEQPPPQ